MQVNKRADTDEIANERREQSCKVPKAGNGLTDQGRIQSEDVWIFGYGSLIWKPEFQFCEAVQAVLDGFTRQFCMYSINLRGTREDPGLVLALRRQSGKICRGIAFRVSSKRAARTLAGLRKRELVASAYFESWETMHLEDGRQITALCFVIDEKHELYCGELCPREQAAIISRASGVRGSNREYLLRTHASLETIGIRDPAISDLADRIRSMVDSSELPG